jgi:hypothetical protein
LRSSFAVVEEVPSGAKRKHPSMVWLGFALATSLPLDDPESLWYDSDQ